MPTKASGGSKSKSRTAEPSVLTEVAQKVGTAVGTVVSVLSGTTNSETNQSGRSKKGSQATNLQKADSAGKKKSTASNNPRFAAKTPKQQRSKKPGSSATEHSPLKRHRIKSK